MSSSSRPTRPLQVWKALSPEMRERAALAFFADEQAVAEQAEVVGLISRRINFRTRSVLAMPVDRKAGHLARMNSISDNVASRLLVAYHLAHQRSMMGAFLDSLGIAHDNGLIATDDVKVPDGPAVLEAARALAARWPPEDVRLYFTTLLLQDPETWGALEGLAEGPPSGSDA